MDSFLFMCLKISLIQIICFLGLFIVIGILLGFLEKKINTNMQKVLGWKGVLFTAIIGTPIHELGHAIMCIVFKHKIDKMCLLNLSGNDGCLGYVSHSYNKHNLYQRIGNFFIAIGPLFSGCIALLTSMYFLIPKSFLAFSTYIKSISNVNHLSFQDIFVNSLTVFNYIFNNENFKTLNFWIFLFISLSISTHIALSWVDIKTEIKSLLFIFILIFIINIFMFLLQIQLSNYLQFIIYYNQIILGFFSISLIFSILFCCLSIFLSKITLFIKS